jgi:hypothetical protein
VGKQSYTWWLLRNNDRKSQHWRIKKQRLYECLAVTSQLFLCGNFSNTTHFKFQKLKGSIGHHFSVFIFIENQNQVSFYPFVLHEIYVLIELTLFFNRCVAPDKLYTWHCLQQSSCKTKSMLKSRTRHLWGWLDALSRNKWNNIASSGISLLLKLPLILHLTSHFITLY